MSCNCGAGGGQVILYGDNGVSVTGSGTAADPYRASGAGVAPVLQLEVRDSSTVNMTIFGSGTRADPYVLRADTSSAVSLRGLGDVSSTPTVQQGAVPLWIGNAITGQFEFRLPGTRYTTNATRGNGTYQGEVIKETDTGKRYEWDGTQWVSLDVVAPAAADFSRAVVDRGTVQTNTAWNSLTSPGIYRVFGGTGNANMPTGAYEYGTLEVLASGLSVTQNYYSHGTSYIYTRTKWNASDWTDWRRQYTANEGTALEGRASSLESRAGSLESTTGNLSSRVGSLESNSGSAVSTGSVQYASNVGANQGCDLTKQGLTVTFRFNIAINGSKNINDNLVQLPAGFRPRSWPVDGTGHNGINIWGMAIDTDGWLRLRTSGIGGGGLWGHFSFQAG